MLARSLRSSAMISFASRLVVEPISRTEAERFTVEGPSDVVVRRAGLLPSGQHKLCISPGANPSGFGRVLTM